jgi:Carbohydrate-binding module 48 (Isoamylase N-terminal domain)
MSMSAEHDDALDDEVLRKVVGDLRKPVRLDPSLDRRALDQIRAESHRIAPPASRRWAVWIAGAAAAAGILLAVALPDRETAPEPASAVALEDATLPADARPVRLRLAAPASSRVAVVGDFNDWDPAATPLHPTGDRGVWTVELSLKPGRYHYTFLIDGRRWQGDPAQARVTNSDFGAPVSVLTVS